MSAGWYPGSRFSMIGFCVSRADHRNNNQFRAKVVLVSMTECLVARRIFPIHRLYKWNIRSRTREVEGMDVRDHTVSKPHNGINR